MPDDRAEMPISHYVLKIGRAKYVTETRQMPEAERQRILGEYHEAAAQAQAHFRAYEAMKTKADRLLSLLTNGGDTT